MQTITYELPRMLRLVHADAFQIPQFQRPFRWKTLQVKLLIDSLFRSYPIGSLLVMSKTTDVPLASRSIEMAIIDDDRDDCGQMTLNFEHGIDKSDAEGGLGTVADAFLVLDGQQRITSMARVFLNADPRRSYYFDLFEMLKGFSGNGEEGDGDVTWIKAYTRGGREPERKKNNRWIRADVVLDVTRSSIFVAEYVEDSGDFDSLPKQQRREKIAQLNGLFEALRKYQIPVVSIDGVSGLQSVCRVFETINSTGTRLTTFDLAVARFFPKPDLRHLNERSKEEHPILMDFAVEGDRILQVIALFNDHTSLSTKWLGTTRSGLLRLPPDMVLKHWFAAAKALAAAYSWVRGQGARPDALPNAAILVTIAGVFMLHPGLLQDSKRNFSSVLRRWYFTRILRRGGLGGANYQVTVDFQDLVGHIEKGTSLTFYDVPLNWEAVLRLTSAQDNQYKAVMCIMAMQMREDIVTQQPLADYSMLEWHHIFPKSLEKRDGWGSVYSINTVANMIAIHAANNRKLGNSQPRAYLGELQANALADGTLTDFRNRLDAAMFPFLERIGTAQFLDAFEKKGFDAFVKARSTLIVHKVRDIIGASLLERSDHEVDEDGQFEIDSD